ncbi:hypothetical protein [uncultured Agrococcus sp.]|uniref:hypothetical protein n=1 Tax=uncultured Agrococcus sp. TaxID=382258 RepID=UPI0025FF9818|nr:hypothetical protein [uncultured Agrococcus sp.]
MTNDEDALNGREENTESLEQQLERLLEDAEFTVASLRRELDGARSRREQEAMLRAQHAEIDRLREHLAEAQVHWGAVREFFEAALRELSSDQQDDDSSGEGQG